MNILATEGKYLDPRPPGICDRVPLKSAVSIPADELRDRLHELPAKDEEVLIAMAEPHSTQALEFLLKGGRQARIADVPFGKSLATRRLWKPNEFLMGLIPSLKRGTALDLGCGSGRESVALAAAGFEVVACDILEDSLEKGRDLEKRYLLGPHPPIRWQEVDLEKDGPPKGPFDLIVSFRYLHRPLLKRISNYLNPAGSLVLETFTTLHRERHGKPSSDDHVLQPGELENLAPGLQVMVGDEGWRGGIHTGRLWAVKVESE